MEKEKSATEKQRQIAEENYQEAQRKTKEAERALEDVVRLTLNEVERLIYSLDYEAAYSKIISLTSLGLATKEVSDALLEFAFWYTEIGQIRRAWGVLDTVYRLAGLTLTPKDGNNSAALSAIARFNSTYFDVLIERYYPKMINVLGGTDTIGGTVTWLGDSIPPFIVTLSTFQMAETEVTWWQYHLFCAANKKEIPKSPGWGTDGDYPAINISWYDAVEYINWLNGREVLSNAVSGELSPSHVFQFRLPTETEWEYAARAGANFLYAGRPDINPIAWYKSNSGNRTQRVKHRISNGNGLYDMSGNVWEWCADWYGDYPINKDLDPRGPKSGSGRILRGGSWNDFAGYCQLTYRDYDSPGYRSQYVGFRPVRGAAF